jgi:hypothetical protein
MTILLSEPQLVGRLHEANLLYHNQGAPLWKREAGGRIQVLALTCLELTDDLRSGSLPEDFVLSELADIEAAMQELHASLGEGDRSPAVYVPSAHW